MLKLTIFQGSPSRAADTVSRTAPTSARPAPTRWLMLLKRSPWYMGLALCGQAGVLYLVQPWLAVPVAVATGKRHEGLQAVLCCLGRHGVEAHGIEHGHHLGHVVRLWAQAHHVYPELAHVIERIDQVVYLGRLRLCAIEHQKAFVFAGLEHQAVRVVQADRKSVV